MGQNRLHQQLEAFEAWKSTLIGTLQDYQTWLDAQELNDADTDLRIYETLETLRSDRLTVAFVAEFSRGKTELINAIFFADYGRRLLPSTAGRTTMCPTELFYDSNMDKAYIQLLPIETRLEDTPLRDFRLDQTSWQRTELDLNDPNQIESALKQVIETKTVSTEAASQLGLHTDDPLLHGDKRPEQVTIPRWRHALISFPHPLLKRGLSILDTPGLNALGAEPELTFGMLPQAQAVLFVLATDTGVTRTDLEVWQHHIKGFRSTRQRGLMVVLNKVDTLWDELTKMPAVESAIEKQRQSTARILGVEESSVFAVSAQKGLVAKIQSDQGLLKRSHLDELESYLSDGLLREKHGIIGETLRADVGHLIDQSRATITERLSNTRQEIEDLKALRGKNRTVIETLMRKSRQEQDLHHTAVAEFQASSKILALQGRDLISSLDLEELDRYIAGTRKQMIGSWTTPQLKSNMAEFLKRVRADMLGVVEQNERTRKLVRTIYRRFEERHGFDDVVLPRMFSIIEYRVKLELLYQEAEEFRKSTKTTLTEQGVVVRKFFVTMVSRVRDTFYQAHTECDTWLKNALQPLRRQINERKRGMQQRLDTLRKIHHSMDTLEQKVAELQEQQRQLEGHLNTLRNMQTTLMESEPMAPEQRPRPRLVSNH